jgi:hypothetical protein
MPSANLLLAKLAVDYVSSKAIMSSNRPCDKVGRDDLDAKILVQDLAYMNTDTPLDTSLEEIRRRAQLALEHAVGNCQMKASLAFEWLAKQAGHPKLELMALDASAAPAGKVAGAITGQQEDFEGPDHVFVVLGRVAGAITDYTTWNAEAVVCDPWAKRYYHSCNLDEEMKLLKRVTGGATRTTQQAELPANVQW